MLRIDVVLVPGGDESREQVLGGIIIRNISGLADVSDYVVNRTRQIPGLRLRNDVAVVRGHRRSDGWGPLLRRACEALWPAESTGETP